MQFRQIPWKYDESGSLWGCWYGDLIVRYFIWPQGKSGKFRVKVGYDRLVGEYATLEAAKKAAQADLEKLVQTAIIPAAVAA